MATYYVDAATGNDANAGTSEGSGNAWATIQKAADTAVAGDIVYIKGGTDYNEAVDWDTNSGTVGSRITFIGYTTTPGDNGKATINGQNTRSYCGSCATVDFITLRNLIFTSPTDNCFITATAACDSWQFINCSFLKGTGSPSYCFGSPTFIRFSTVMFAYCIFDGADTGGISQSLFSNTVSFLCCKFLNINNNALALEGYRGPYSVIGCLFVNNTVDGLFVTSPLTAFIVGNTFANNGRYGCNMGTMGGNNNIIITRNIFANHSGAGDAGLTITGQAGNNIIFCDYNGYYNNTTHKSGPRTSGDNDVTYASDPFVNSAGGDFNLAAVAKNAAQFDFDGTNINYMDFGALQHQDSGGPASSVFNKGILTGGKL